MKRAIWALVVLALTPGISYGQDRALEKTLIANENRLNEAIAKRDRETFLSLIAPNAVSMDKGGFVPGAAFAKVLDQVNVTSWKIVNPQVIRVDGNNAIVTYTWTGSGTFMKLPVDSPTLVATLWTKRGNKWLAVFHSETASAKK